MAKEFNFQFHTNLFYGVGWSKNIGSLLKDNNFSNVLILVDEGVEKTSTYYPEIEQIIRQNCKVLYREVLRGNEEPDYDYLDEISNKVRAINELDVMIGVGGGSCLDMMKALAVLKTNSGNAINYRGMDKVQKSGAPTIAIPTTAGTGSEATMNASFIDKKEMKKLGINGRYMSASYAILDAEWTLSCPYFVAISSVMDAITHALESFMCKEANYLTRMYSMAAFRLLYSALTVITDQNEWSNKEKRQQLLLGSYLAGIAISNSGGAIAGPLSYPIGVHFKVPHGIGGGILIMSVVEFNVKHGYLGFAELFDLIESQNNLSSEEKSKRFVVLLKDLTKKLKVPHYLTQWGLTKENVYYLEDHILQLQESFDDNPVPFFAEQDAMELLKKHLK